MCDNVPLRFRGQTVLHGTISCQCADLCAEDVTKLKVLDARPPSTDEELDI